MIHFYECKIHEKMFKSFKNNFVSLIILAYSEVK